MVRGLDRDFIDNVLAKQAGRPGGLLAILQQVQGSHPRKYLPRETIEYIAAKTKIPLSRIFSVVTFYALFNLRATGPQHGFRLPRHRLPHQGVA